MTSHKFSRSFLRLGTAFAVTSVALSGCSTVKSISPFGSNVPYAQDIQPTLPRPAVTEIPAFKPKAEAPPAPKPRPAPVIATPPGDATPPAAPAEPAPAPAPASPVEPPPAPAAAPAPPASQSSAAPVQAPRVAETAPQPAPAVEKPVEPPAAAPEAGVPEKTSSNQASDSEVGDGPSIPADHKKLSEDGAFPNLAQVPPRPVNMPTFAEAAALEKSLVANRDTAKNASPDSPALPAVDSEPTAAPVDKPMVQAASTTTAIAPRAEDRSPCLSGSGTGTPAVTFQFDPGSAALTSGNLARLSEAMPTVRGAKGTIRVYGHGDSQTAPASRFDLAAARAQAVAQAVVGYGIPAPRIAVGVACADNAFAGSSVQLYTES